MMEAMITNEELVASLQVKMDETKLKILMQRFKPLIRKYATLYYLPHYDYDDFEQLAYIMIFKVIQTFNPTTHKYFAPYLKKAYVNKLKNEIRYFHAQRRRIERETLMISDVVGEPQMTPIGSQKQTNINDIVVIRNIYEEVIQNFSKLEKKVFLHYLKGKNYQEIAQVVGKSERSVRDTVYRIRKKFKQIS